MNKKKKSVSTAKSSTKSNHSLGKNGQNGKDSDDEEDQSSDDDYDESEPMDFDRAFGNVSDALKIEHMDVYHKDGFTNGLNVSEGDSYFDLSKNIDLKSYTQPVLLSSTINLNSLAAVRIPNNHNDIDSVLLL